jgi:hypothetical protein
MLVECGLTALMLNSALLGSSPSQLAGLQSPPITTTFSNLPRKVSSCPRLSA